MIDIRKLKELVRLMVANDLTELDLRDSEEQVTLRRPGPAQPGAVAMAPAVAAAPVAQQAPADQTPPTAAPTPETIDEDLIRIESPMVGTFYSQPNPDSDQFVSVGSPVSPDTVVCLIEAMKIFNEIKAEASGTIHRVMVNSGDAVEFGQVLYLLKSA